MIIKTEPIFKILKSIFVKGLRNKEEEKEFYEGYKADCNRYGRDISEFKI